MSQIPLNTFLGHLGVMLCMGREGGHTMDGSGLDTLQMQTLKIQKEPEGGHTINIRPF